MVNQYVNPNHSEQLQKRFDISPIGVDWYNPFDIPIEFKESISNNRNVVIFIHNHQLIESDLIVICYKHSEFYIHKTKYLKKKYKQNNKTKRIGIRLNSLRKNYLAKFNNYDDLEKYLKNLKTV